MTRLTPPTNSLHVLGQEGETLGAREEMVFEYRQFVSLAVGNTGCVLLLSEPAALSKEAQLQGGEGRGGEGRGGKGRERRGTTWWHTEEVMESSPHILYPPPLTHSSQVVIVCLLSSPPPPSPPATDQHWDRVVLEVVAVAPEPLLVPPPVPAQYRVLHEDEAPPDAREVLGHILHVCLSALQGVGSAMNTVTGGQ